MIISTVSKTVFSCWESLNFFGTLSKLHAIMFLKIKNLYNKKALTAAFSLPCLEIRSRTEEVINSTQKSIYSLKVFYFLLYRHRYFLFVSELIFNTRVSDDQKYLCCRRLYACVNTQKFKGLDSREITSFPEIKKVIYMARHFNHHQK